MALSKNTSLQEVELIHLGMENSKMTFQALAQSLRNNTTLHYLKIITEEITEDEWEMFTQTISYMQGLQIFEFSFDDYENSEEPSPYCKQIAAKLIDNTAFRRISYMDQLSPSERWNLDLNKAGRSILMDRTCSSMALWACLVSRLGTKYHQWKHNCSIDPTFANENQMPLDLLHYLLRHIVDVLATIS